MICGKCNVKMSCKESYCWNNETYRRYKCSICGVHMYTIEKQDNPSKVQYAITQKRINYLENRV